MICCLGIALVMGLIRQGWRSLTFAGEASPAAPLPPPARRPQPGTAVFPVAARSGEPRFDWEFGVLTRARAALGLRFAVCGIVLYAVAVALLSTSRVASLNAEAAGWAIRAALLALLILVAAIVARRWARTERSLHGRERLACALIGIGAVWLELGLLDMHVLGLLEMSHAALGWDAVFHGLPAAAFVVGWALLVGTDRLKEGTWHIEPSTVN